MSRWVVLVLLCAAPLSAATVQELYAQAVRASIRGDNATAKQLFLRVLASDPNNKAAAANLRRIELATAAQGDLKARLERVIVPKVDFRDASLNAVLDYLPKLVEQQTGGKESLNLVRMFPKDYGDGKHITLQLSNVPVPSVIAYVAELGGLRAAYEKAAVILRLAEKPEAAQ